MSVNIKTNIIQVEKALQEKFAKLEDKEYLLRPVMESIIDLMHKRIHNDGKAADGNAIGTYSSSYLKLREDRLPAKITKGKHKGEPRPKYNRMEGSKVVISLTRQLENDWVVKENSIIETPKGYGIGFLDKHNYDKSQWVEATYKKPIFKMTEGEHDFAIEYINDLVNAALSE